MLDIQRISKTFNPGTVNEKKAITDLSLPNVRQNIAQQAGSHVISVPQS